MSISSLKNKTVNCFGLKSVFAFDEEIIRNPARLIKLIKSILIFEKIELHR